MCCSCLHQQQSSCWLAPAAQDMSGSHLARPTISKPLMQWSSVCACMGNKALMPFSSSRDLVAGLSSKLVIAKGSAGATSSPTVVSSLAVLVLLVV